MSRKLGLLWCLPHELTIKIVPTPVRGSRNKGENIRIFPLWVLITEAQVCLYPLTNVQAASVWEKPRCEGCALSEEEGREANITAKSLPQHSQGPLRTSVSLLGGLAHAPRRSLDGKHSEERALNTWPGAFQKEAYGMFPEWTNDLQAFPRVHGSLWDFHLNVETRGQSVTNS